MIKNYLRVALRNLLKNKSASFINILGLAIGLCSCLLIGIYIQHELSYDQFEKKGTRLVRVIMEYSFNGSDAFKKGNFTSMKLAPVVKRNFPEVEGAVRMFNTSRVIRYQEKLLNEQKFMYADSGFFNMFSFHLLEGDSADVLNAPNKLVLTKSTALRYFGNQDPMGKLMQVGADSTLYMVSGVMADCPTNSQIKFDFLASFISLNVQHEEESYWDANYTTYLLLRNPKGEAPVEKKLNAFMKKEMAGQGASIRFSFEPFMGIHLHSEYGGFEPNNNIRYIYMLEGIAVLLLAIACFTYINLNTARSVERAKEVGVRKVAGAGKGQLFWQFIGESFLVCLIAVGFSIGAAVLILPFFNELTAVPLPVSELFSISTLTGALLLAVLVSLLAGTYPAVLLTRMVPSRVLKGSFKNTVSGQWMRKSLIVFQFAISVVLIASTFIMQKQLHFVQNKNLGYTRDQVLVLPFDSKMESTLPIIKQEFKSNANILHVSRCRSTPVNIQSGYNMRSSGMPANQQIAVTADPVDDEFIATVGLQIVAGTNFTPQDLRDLEQSADSNLTYHFILNESAARQLGWSAAEAVNKKMFLDEGRPGYVRGVVRDFNFESLHQSIKPIVLFPEPRGYNLMLKLRGGSIPETIAFLESKWKTLVPHRPFEYHFLEEDFNALYQSELRLGKVLNIFAGIAIALACLGLLGLSAFTVRQRQKEIGIRKVLGAGIGQIAALLSVEFTWLVLIAIGIAIPVSWIFMYRWLQDFAYHISVEWWVFGLAALMVTGITLITISFQVIRAAIANPVTSLRAE
jgi:putative ABC transport system permease protein